MISMFFNNINNCTTYNNTISILFKLFYLFWFINTKTNSYWCICYLTNMSNNFFKIISK